MTKAELKRDLSASVNGASMMTAGDVQRFLGRGRTFTTSFLRGVESFGGERKGKLYFVGDIAERIMEMRCQA